MGKCRRVGQVLFLLIAVGACLTHSLSPLEQNSNDEDDLRVSSKSEDLPSHPLDYENTAFDHSTWDFKVPEVDKKENATKNDTNYTHILQKLALGNNDSFFKWDSWDYDEDYGWWSGSEEYSDENSEDHDDEPIITVAAVRSSTVRIPLKIEDFKYETIVSKDEDVKTTQRTLSLSIKTGEKSSSKKELKPESDPDYWRETLGDEDDGLEEEVGVKSRPVPIVKDIPSDNDPDADRLFNPDYYKELDELHAIEDLMRGTWTVLYPYTNRPCIMLKGDIKLVVPLNPTMFNMAFVEITVPSDAKATGTCQSLNNDYQEMTLNWNVSVPGSARQYPNKITFGFATNWTSDIRDLSVPEDKYALVAVTATYYKGELGEMSKDTGIVSYSVTDFVDFVTPLNMSMSCFQDKSFILGGMQLTMSNFQMEAFRPDSETLYLGDFSRSEMCNVDEEVRFDAVMTFIIWFWIGSLLAVLIIFIVLLGLGYRKKGRKEGGFGYKVLEA